VQTVDDTYIWTVAFVDNAVRAMESTWFAMTGSPVIYASVDEQFAGFTAVCDAMTYIFNTLLSFSTCAAASDRLPVH
jgi:hypothetical protein